MLRGFDVSHHQGSVNWQSLRRNHGIAFGAIKASEGETFVDDQFKANRAKLHDQDLFAWLYHYGRPARNPIDSAHHHLSVTGLLQPDEYHVLDLETSDGLSQAQVNEWAKVWGDVIHEDTGQVPGLYMGSGYLTNHTGDGLDGPYGSLWYPRPRILATSTWPTAFTPPPPRNALGRTVQWKDTNWGRLPDAWQWSFSFQTIEGKLDADLFDGTLGDLRALAEIDTMALTDADIALIKAMPLSNTITEETGDTVTLGFTLAADRKRLYDTKVKVDGVAADVAAIKLQLAQLQTGGVDLDALASKLADELQRRLQS